MLSSQTVSLGISWLLAGSLLVSQHTCCLAHRGAGLASWFFPACVAAAPVGAFRVREEAAEWAGGRDNSTARKAWGQGWPQQARKLLSRTHEGHWALEFPSDTPSGKHLRAGKKRGHITQGTAALDPAQCPRQAPAGEQVTGSAEQPAASAHGCPSPCSSASGPRQHSDASSRPPATAKVRPWAGGPHSTPGSVSLPTEGVAVATWVAHMTMF